MSSRTRARAVTFTCLATVAISREAAADTDIASSLFFVGGETHLDHAKLHAPPTTAEPDLLKNRRLTLNGSGRELGGGVMLTLTTHDTRVGLAIAVIGVQHATAVVDPMPANVGVRNDATWGEHIELFVGRSIDFKTVRPYLDVRGTFCLLQTSVGLVTPAYGFTGSAPYNVFAFGVGPRLGTWIPLGKFAFADVAIQYDAVGPERLTGMLGLGVHAGLD